MCELRYGATLQVVEHVGAAPGPRVALLGGVHGDEEEGVLAVQSISRILAERPLARGSVHAVGVASPAAYAAATRVSPLDNLNLARCFPGDPDGSATERLAHELTVRVIRGSDFLIDLHSAGRNYAMPTFVGYVNTGDELAARSQRGAIDFAAPILWEHPGPVPPGRSLSAAIAMGIPAIYAEGSGGGSVQQEELDLYVGGVLRVLGHLGLLSWTPPAGQGPRLLVRGDGGDLDGGVSAPRSGRFIAACEAGDVIGAGTHIGSIVDEAGSMVAELLAPRDCTVMFLRRTTRILAGEVVCSLSGPAVPWDGTHTLTSTPRSR